MAKEHTRQWMSSSEIIVIIMKDVLQSVTASQYNLHSHNRNWSLSKAVLEYFTYRRRLAQMTKEYYGCPNLILLQP